MFVKKREQSANKLGKHCLLAHSFESNGYNTYESKLS